MLPRIVVLAAAFAAAAGAPADGPDVSLSLGPRVTLLEDGALGLRDFPDAAIAVLRRSPPRLIMAAGVASVLVEGPELERLDAARRVLGPGGAGEFDNGYAGISGIYRHRDGTIYAIYHAEDQEGTARFHNGVPGYYGRVGLAASADGGATFEKAGPIIESAQRKNTADQPDQGCGEACLALDRAGRHLFAYYVDHSRAGGRGVQICLARAAVHRAAPLPGTWRKWHEGGFTRDALGGPDTPVVSAADLPADATFPHVTFVPGLDRYVMVFNVVAYLEHPDAQGRGEPSLSGTYVATSRDGVRWSKPEQLLRAYAIPFAGRELAWHPALVPDGGDATRGWLLYGYTPRWGYGDGAVPHHLVGHRYVLADVPVVK